MNRRVFGTLGVLAVLVATVSCKSDPLSDLDGEPAAIVKQFSVMHIATGGNATVTASVVDGRFTPLVEDITFTSSAAGFTVAEDGSYNPVPATSERAVVSAASAGSGFIIIQGGGLRDSVQVISP